MPDIRPALPALLLLCACTAPRLTVTEVGDPFATVYSNVPGVTADNSTCPEGFVPLFPGEPFYRLAPNRTQALLHFRFTDRDGIRSAEVGIENASAVVVFPETARLRAAPGHGYDTVDSVVALEYADPAATRTDIALGALIRDRGSSGGAFIHFRATDGDGRSRSGVFSVRPFTTACTAEDG